jgi:aconitate hydratase
VAVTRHGENFRVNDGSVVIAAITSCTNTSNPAVMLGAGIVAKKAAARGLKAKPWVKTSLAPGSKVVTDYLEQTGLLTELEKLGFYVVGYGCTTCIGNSGPLPEEVSKGIAEGDLAVARGALGQPQLRGPRARRGEDELPRLAAAGGGLRLGRHAGHRPRHRADRHRQRRPAGVPEGHLAHQPGDLRRHRRRDQPAMFAKNYADVFKGDERWNGIAVPGGDVYRWDDSTYIKNPPYFDGMTMEAGQVADIHGARVLGLFGDSITTDHISPAGSIKKDSPAGRFLIEKGVAPKDFNSYGSRRGNDDVMVRGTFANIRIKNQLLDGVEGGYTKYIPSGEQMAIYDAAMKYKADGTALMVIAGKEYGTGSSRDWAAKGTLLLGVKAVLAESFERIHRSNLVGMGVLPLQFKAGENAKSLGLTGTEAFDITGLSDGNAKEATITATAADGSRKTFTVHVMLLTPKEREFFRHGGILQYVLRQLAGKKAA